MRERDGQGSNDKRIKRKWGVEILQEDTASWVDQKLWESKRKQTNRINDVCIKYSNCISSFSGNLLRAFMSYDFFPFSVESSCHFAGTGKKESLFGHRLARSKLDQPSSFSTPMLIFVFLMVWGCSYCTNVLVGSSEERCLYHFTTIAY